MEVEKGYTYDDVLLIPKKSKITSRSLIDISTDLGRGVILKIPIVSANMRDVTGMKMAITIARMGGLAILHRFDGPDYNQAKVFEDATHRGSEFVNNIGVSVGVKKEDIYRARTLIDLGAKIICVDVAHGHHENVCRMIQTVRGLKEDALIIAGNVATHLGAIFLGQECDADVVKVGVGPGCFAAGTRILMSDGMYKNIEDICPGDRVINQEGKPRTVESCFSTGRRRVSRVRNSVWYDSTLVTADHKYFVGDLSTTSKETLATRGYAHILERQSKTTPKRSKYKWQEIGKSQNVALLLPKTIRFELPDAFSIDLRIRDGGNGHSSIKSRVDVSLSPSYDLGYILGTFLGDGCSGVYEHNHSKIGSVEWYFGLKERLIAEKLSTCLARVLGKKLKVEKKASILLCSLYYKPFADFLQEFGKKEKKHLPCHLLVSHKPYLKGLFDGLVDSDGHLSKNGRLSFDNTSRQLIELFNVLTYLLTGVFPNNQMKEKSPGGLKNCNPDNLNQPYVARINRTAEKRTTKDWQISKLLEYTPTNDIVDVYDLTINCDTHSFIADNAIVHNSLCTTRIETGNGVPQLTALEHAYLHRNEHHYKSSCGYTYCSGTTECYKVIADGGIKSAGDITKALCFSHAAMVGNLLAGSSDAPGDVIVKDGRKYMRYSGSSTHKTSHIEGVSGLVSYKGSSERVVNRLVEGLRSGMSYQGASTLDELREDPKFVSISHAGLTESQPHDVMVIGE
jgi:IMP dehydrogenase/GMP reductase